jgi:hypothetical protein
VVDEDYKIDIFCCLAALSSSPENLDLSDMDLKVLIFATLGLIESWVNGESL